MKIYRASQVFVPGGMPSHTYVPRSERRLEERLKAAKDNLCKLVTITGATKSGKTVLTNKVFPRKSTVWVDGGTIKEEDDLWSSILEQLDGYSERSTQESQETISSLNGKMEAQTGIPFIKGTGAVGANYSKKLEQGESKILSVTPRSAAISQLRSSQAPLIIDDFHYLNRDFQGNIIRALKPLIFDGLPVILIAIPHRRYDAVKVEREMTGRLEPIPIPTWDADELLKIPKGGFPLLNLAVSEAVYSRLAKEAYGSPHLMQEFCRELCKAREIEETVKSGATIKSLSNDLFQHVAQNTGKVIFDKLAKGPRQRSDRIQRKLKTGDSADIYKVTLLALARLRPGMDTIEYETLRLAIREILSDNIPQAKEVTRVLEKMAEIAMKDEASTPVLDWEKEDQKLHITDPFFAFFLKWGFDNE